MTKLIDDSLIVVGSFILNFISVGIAHSFGIIYTELVHYFSASRSNTSWIASLGLGLMLLFGPVAGLIEERIGCSIIAFVGSALIGIGLGASCFVDSLYLLYLTYGVVTGIGFSLCHVAANVSVNVHFKTRRVMAAGLSSAGCAVGTIVFPIIGTRLIEEYMWQGAFLIMAGIGLQGIYCGLMLKRSKDSSRKHRYSTTVTEENQEIREDKTEITYETQAVNVREELERSNRSNIWIKTKEIYRTPTFLLFIISGTCVSLAFFVPFVMLPDMLIERGMRKYNAALMITTTGIASIISRLVFGFLSDSSCMNRLAVNGIALLILGASTSFICLFEHKYLLFLYSAILGIVTGIFGMYRSVVVVDIVGREHMSLAYGYVIFFDGTAIMIGPPLAGFLYDVTNSFDLSFVSSGVLFLAGGILSICAATLTRFEKKPKKEDYMLTCT